MSEMGYTFALGPSQGNRFFCWNPVTLAKSQSNSTIPCVMGYPIVEQEKRG